MGLTGDVYQFLLLLHIVGAVLGFGALAFNGFYFVSARHRGGAGGAAVIEINSEVSRIAEFFVYAVFVLGVLLVTTSKSAWKFSQFWLGAAMALYIVSLGVLHGLVRRNQRRYHDLIEQVNGASGEPATEAPAGHQTQVKELVLLEKRISAGWAIFDVAFLIVLYLMVFKPGS